MLRATGVYEESFWKPHLNTSTVFDYAIGRFERGFDNRFYLNGGVNWVPSVVGRPQTCKSTLTDCLIARIMQNYYNTEYLKIDSEISMTSIERLDDYVDTPVSHNACLKTAIDFNLDTLYEFIRDEIIDVRRKDKDRVEYPFINPRTGKRYVTYRPFIVGMDSYSRFASGAEADAEDNNSLSDSKNNARDIHEGNKKVRFLKAIIKWAAQYNIIFALTAHVGDKIILDQYQPGAKSKDLTFMKVNDKIKHVGNQFNFSVLSQIHNARAAALQNSGDKMPQYPMSYSTPTELLLIDSIITRGKEGAGSGTVVQGIFSQFEGYMPELSNYHYLKQHKNAGLNGNNTTQQCKLTPDISVNRKTVRQAIKDNPQLKRSLQIVGEYEYVKNAWSLFNSPVDRSMSTDEFADTIMEDSVFADEVRHSRGHWTLSDDPDIRPQWSLFDIIDHVNKNRSKTTHVDVATTEPTKLKK
jgi:hypothetical protein